MYGRRALASASQLTGRSSKAEDALLGNDACPKTANALFIAAAIQLRRLKLIGEPVVTACLCAGSIQPLYGADGKPLLERDGVVLCPRCARSPWDHSEYAPIHPVAWATLKG